MNAKQYGTLVILACHGVFDLAMDLFRGLHRSDRPIYEAHLSYALKHLEWRAVSSPLLVISGGPTQKERRCSESESYVEQATAMGLKVPANLALEKFALTSIENVIFSLYVYFLKCGYYPASVEVISWEFKRKRFEETLRAINRWQRLGVSWPQLDFFPVGDLWGRPKEKAMQVEENYIASLKDGLDAYYQNPGIQSLLQDRDPHNSRVGLKAAYTGFPIPF